MTKMLNNRIAGALSICIGVAACLTVLSGADDAESKRFSDATMDLGIVVSDLDRSIRFYTDVIGLETDRRIRCRG